MLTFVFMLMACSSPQKEAKKTLEQRGITYNERTFFANVVAGKAVIAELFLQAGMSPDVKEADKTALMEAARRAHSEIARDLIKAGADVNAKTKEGITVFMLVVNSQAAQAFIDAGADVNARDNEGKIALMRAVARGNIRAVRTLVDAGADVRAKDNYGISSLMRAKDKNEIAKILREAGAKK